MPDKNRKEEPKIMGWLPRHGRRVFTGVVEDLAQWIGADEHAAVFRHGWNGGMGVRGWRRKGSIDLRACFGFQ